MAQEKNKNSFPAECRECDFFVAEGPDGPFCHKIIWGLMSPEEKKEAIAEEVFGDYMELSNTAERYWEEE